MINLHTCRAVAELIALGLTMPACVEIRLTLQPPSTMKEWTISGDKDELRVEIEGVDM